MDVREVSREIPLYYRDGTFHKVKSSTCIKYALPRVGTVTWKMLQRDAPLNSEYYGYTLIANPPIDEELSPVLRSIAKQYSEEYFEFEAIKNEVSVYWEEWGGDQKVNEVFQTLKEMARH